MEKIVMNTAKTDTSYCCSCDLLPGWIVTGPEDFEKFKKEVQDSIRFYVDCARKDGDAYPPVLDADYEIEYQFIKKRMTYQ